MLALMAVVAYGTAIARDAGQVPSTYVPDIEDSDSPIHEIKRKVRFFLVGFLNFSSIRFFMNWVLFVFANGDACRVFDLS